MATLEVCDLNQAIVISAIMSRLLKNDLKRSLVKAYPWDFFDMLVQMEKYAYMEEVFVKDEAPTSSIMREK